MRFRSGIAGLALVLVTAGTGLLASGVPAQATSAKAEVTVVHGIPNTPVTVYANNKVLIKRFVFGKTATVALTPGAYALAVRAYGSMATAKPVLAATVHVIGGENATVVANLTAGGKPTLTVFANPTTAVPTGDARVIVRHVAEAPAVDVYAGATSAAPLIAHLANPKSSAPANVPAGSYSISVYPTGTKTTPVIGPASFKFSAGKTYIIYAIGSLKAKSLTVAVQTY
jgi:hypothetical protein